MKMDTGRQTVTLSIWHKAEFFQGGRDPFLLSSWCHRSMKTIDLNTSCFKAIKTAVHNNIKSWKTGKKSKFASNTTNILFKMIRWTVLCQTYRSCRIAASVTELQNSLKTNRAPQSPSYFLGSHTFIHTAVKANSKSPGMRDITFYIVLVLAHLLLMQHWVNTHWANPGG